MSCRSADAARFDPPVSVRRFVVGRELGLAELLAEAAARLGGAAAAAERALWHGGIHVNGRPLDAAALPSCVAAGSWVVVYAFEREPEEVPFESDRVLHDADGIVAVDKPPWLPMQRTRASARFSFESTLRERLGDPSLVAAHRLDRQTSGVALFARGAAGAWVQRAFEARRIAKRYLAATAPPPCGDAFEVSGWLARAGDPARFRFALDAEERPGARWSLTRFRVVERNAESALVEARPETGRTHQIRVHLAAVGAPILGDALYGGALDAPRCLLHAASLTLPRPTGAPLHLEAPLPPDFATASGDVGQDVKKCESPTS